MLVVTLREGWFMGRVIVTEDEFAPSILVMVSVHDLGLFTCEVYKLPKVEHRAIRKLQMTFDETSHRGARIYRETEDVGKTCRHNLFNGLT